MRTAAWVAFGMGMWACGACLAASDVEPRVADLQSPLAAVRVEAAVALGRASDRSAVPALTAALEDQDSGVRREAAKALGMIKDGRAAPALAKALRDEDPNVRMYAAYALGEVKDRRAAAVLLAALRDPEWCVRDQAAWALRELHDPGLVEPLAAMLREEGADVPHVTWLLQQIGGPKAVEAIASLLQSPSADSRLQALKILSKYDDARLGGWLLASLDDPSAAIRGLAIESLVKRRVEAAKKPLEKLARGDDDPAIREAAGQAVMVLSREPGLVGWWSFDDGNAKVAADVTGLGNDGQIRGAVPCEGKVGRALRFGPDKYIELGKAPGLPIGNKPFTVMAWAKTEGPNGVVVARGGAFCGYSLYIKDGLPKFGIHRVEDGPGFIAAGSEPVVGRWVHLAGVVREDRIELYVDGKLAATEKTAGFIPGNCGQGMEIGFDVSNSPAEIVDPLDGVIDEVKQYEVALGEEEIGKEAGATKGK